MKIFVSVVSHLDHDIVINLGTIKRLAVHANIEVICRDNKPISKLKIYCEKYDVKYIGNQQEVGFSTNNNANFLFFQKELGMREGDYFLLLNPDIFMSDETIDIFLAEIGDKQPTLATCNLYLDREYMVHDDNIRTYPTFLNFVKTYLLQDRATMVKRDHQFNLTEAHWVSCSCLLVKSDIYQQLHGLDESYYMYCEDIDFGYRAKLAGLQTAYLENVKLVHYRRRDSKRFLSKYFYWHVKSVVRYSLVTKKIHALKSCLAEL
ncbi:glycosyltransferase family 2 protein [Psychromonas hadalis]|uniref:glycosyltransferase family 2 protein n=1 Tax=Psychromonas hadalis TaxID=211669 RepID=UPI0003B3B89A|nr:glycosyltransferase family 2 protein [Psychromonas hadalis]